MVCKNCGTQNVEGTKVCVKCGNVMEGAPEVVTPTQSADSNQVNLEVNNVAVTQNQNNVVTSNGTTTESVSQSAVNAQNNTGNKINVSIFRSYWDVIRSIILKPLSGLKEEINKFNDIKDSAIFALIVSVVALVLSFIKSVLSVVRV